MRKLLAAVIGVLIFSLSANAQNIKKQYPGICTDVTNLGSANPQGFFPCSWFQAGSGATTPEYVRLVDQNTTLAVDVERLTTIMTDLSGAYRAEITAAALMGLNTATGNTFRALTATNTPANQHTPGLSLNVNAALFANLTGTNQHWALEMDANGNLHTNIRSPLDAAGNVQIGIYDTTGGGPATFGSGAGATGLRITPPNDTRFQISDDNNANSVTNTIHVELSDGAAAFLDNTASPGYFRKQDGDSTVLADVLDAVADGLALSLNWDATASVMLGYNGATVDMVRVNANKSLVTGRDWTLAGEDAGNDWQKIKKEQTASVTPPKTTTTVDSLEDIIASREIINDVNWCVWIDNTGGADLTALNIEVSPDGTSFWQPLNIAPAGGQYSGVRNDDCIAALASGTDCVYCVDDNAYRYLRVQANCGSSTTVDAWYTANKD